VAQQRYAAVEAHRFSCGCFTYLNPLRDAYLPRQKNYRTGSNASFEPEGCCFTSFGLDRRLDLSFLPLAPANLCSVFVIMRHINYSDLVATGKALVWCQWKVPISPSSRARLVNLEYHPQETNRHFHWEHR
jgi:hypothetical protein